MASRRATRLPIIRADAKLLAAFMAVGALLLAGFKLASEVMEGETQALDAAILRSLRAATEGQSLFQTWLRSLMLDLTALGDDNILALMGLFALGYLVATRKSRLALMTALTVGLGIATTFWLKAHFNRARPDVVTHLVATQTASFPSGHAMNSALVYLTLGALLARAQKDRAARFYVLGCALSLTLLIGLSRLYLGVHWPSDVLAGWIFGAGWAAATSILVARLQGRHAVESPGR